MMAHEYEKQFHGCPNGQKTSNGISDFELTMDGQEQVRETSDAFGNEWLRAEGNRQAKKWAVAGSGRPLKILDKRWTIAQASVERALMFLQGKAHGELDIKEQQRWILDSARFLRGVLREIREALKSLRKLPGTQTSPESAEILPRVYRITCSFLQAVGFDFSEAAFGKYLTGVQQVVILEMRELWALKPLLQLALIEELGGVTDTLRGSSDRGPDRPDTPRGIPSTLIQSLHQISEMQWNEFFEAASVVDHVLRSDPSGVYPQMDFESRQLYRDAIADLASGTKLSEAEIAARAIHCARKARDRKTGLDPRAAERRSTVGFYLVDSGVLILKKLIGYRSPPIRKLRDKVLDWPEIYYVAGVELPTLVMVFALLWHLGPPVPLIPCLLLLVPASQVAVDMVNQLTSWLVPPQRLARLDFADGIPDEFLTLAVVPSLLLNEKEVRHIVEALEVRYLGNRDPNLHFALLTDSPDASHPSNERDELVALSSFLIEQLNAKYAHDHKGSFFHFHRYHVYNAAEEAWMGWERKRGKLLDLNNLLLGQADNFPVKAGDLSILSKVRYVITLDSDTRLPRDTAHKLIGTLAHPLNRAVIDRRTNTIVEGYGILQPRVGISIESARKSRLASIYSGETGFDIYTRAVSDVYQDLFGEGSFTGKGIYEVRTFQRVLANRFPSNSLLSHDLIEGVYGRAGLVSDVEVIDDYPSHFSAYYRRMHRWVRGDWQILRWLFPTVPDAFGRQIPNPITLLSRWKIFDNLRRSLVELSLFVLLLAGWFFFHGGALYWTAIILALLLTPTYVQAAFSLLRAKGADNLRGFLRKRANDFVTGHLRVFVMVVFLPHKAFVMLDAIVRTLTRLTITHKNLLEWETAAEAEAGIGKRTAVEAYLAVTPWFALVTGLSLALVRPSALLVAAPILGLWMSAGVFTKWINQAPRRARKPLKPEDNEFLRLSSLATWRYFREFSSAEVNWLIPDRVQETPPAVVDVMSPTNLGILLNARLVACNLGYLTLPEFVEQTEQTVRTAKLLPRFRGHFLNWYDVKTLKPLPPKFVSTVDSGNLAACLITLKQACYGLPNEPIISEASWQGIRDHISLLGQLLNQVAISPDVMPLFQELDRSAENIGEQADWINFLPGLGKAAGEATAALCATREESRNNHLPPPAELNWWCSETLERIEHMQGIVQTFMPWLMPEFRKLHLVSPPRPITLNSLLSVIPELELKLNDLPVEVADNATEETVQSLRSRLEASLRRAVELSERLRHLAEEAKGLLKEMDFRFLYDEKRKLLSIGYDVEAQKLAKSVYDLLASEARTATFIAIAKDDIRQEAWFHLGRERTYEQGEITLASWSGTMFEYLMPLLWMRSYSGTLLNQCVDSAVVCQQRYARKMNVPWGISEAAFKVRDDKGIYQYRAFGLPGLSVDPSALNNVVIAPYATFLALMVDPSSATKNLRVMRNKGWFGRYGFYESADYSNGQMGGTTDYELIRCWMAHHQGMSLLAVCNLLTHSSLQRWFHQDHQVIATELLLHERIPLSPPERNRRARQPLPSQRIIEEETAARSTPPEPAYAFSGAVEATEAADDVSLEATGRHPATDRNIPPLQAQEEHHP